MTKCAVVHFLLLYGILTTSFSIIDFACFSIFDGVIRIYLPSFASASNPRTHMELSITTFLCALPLSFPFAISTILGTFLAYFCIRHFALAGRGTLVARLQTSNSFILQHLNFCSSMNSRHIEEPRSTALICTKIYKYMLIEIACNTFVVSPTSSVGFHERIHFPSKTKHHIPNSAVTLSSQHKTFFRSLFQDVQAYSCNPG